MCSTGCETPLECLGGVLDALSGQNLKSLFGPAVLARPAVLLREVESAGRRGGARGP